MKKIIYNLDKSTYQHDVKLFKKLDNEIWEFRTKYGRVHYRLFAFWDKNDNKQTFVIVTHGIIKKVSKVPRIEIEKAISLKKEYLNAT